MANNISMLFKDVMMGGFPTPILKENLTFGVGDSGSGEISSQDKGFKPTKIN